MSKQKYIGSYGISNGCVVGIKSLEYGIDDVVEWDLLTDKVVDSGESAIEYYGEQATFKVREIDVNLGECIRI